MLHRGDPIPVKSLIDSLNERTADVKAIEKPEGIIYRNEYNNKIDFLAKWVRPDFESGSEMKNNKLNIFK